MELLENYKGAVLFVDILGISALTNNKINLNKDDFEPWLGNRFPHTNQYLGAAILAEFRELLIKLNNEQKNVTVTQLSDCAFIWSKDIVQVIMFASKFMHQAIERGILCRGGMAYGEIIETNQSHDLGRFILGDAVTQAAKLEGKPKGCRILVNSEFPHSTWEGNPHFSRKIVSLFQPFTDPLDYSIYDEFKWYLIPQITSIDTLDISCLEFSDKVAFTKNRLKLANKFRAATKFSWNSRSQEGLVQLIASINFLSENKIMNVLHNFAWENVIELRDDSTVVKIEKIFMNYTDYRKIEAEPFPDDWEE